MSGVCAWLLVTFFCALVRGQKNLVIIGGSLADNNDEIYGKIIELAVSKGSQYVDSVLRIALQASDVMFRAVSGSLASE